VLRHQLSSGFLLRQIGASLQIEPTERTQGEEMVTENTITDAESTEASAEPTLADLQVLLEASEANTKKLENDLRSERGQRTRDQGFNELVEDIGGIKAQLVAIANRTASGETESLPADFAEIDQKKAATTATRNWQSNYDEAERNLADALMDDEENVLLDKEAIARLSTQWQEAQKKYDLHGLYRVIGQAGKEARAVERQKSQAAVTETKETAKAAKKVSDSKNGVHDLSVGVPSGIGSGKSRTQVESATSINDISDDDYAKFVADG
jgi:translation elongation factor EF-1beta